MALKFYEIFYEKWGWSAVVVARFMPWMRSLIPPVAGIARMNYYKFLSANFVGAIVWGTGMSFVGYFAAQNESVKSVAYVIGLGFITASIVAGFINWKKDQGTR